ncbi:unnamed protein product [Camellia sinensis]
MWCSGYSKKGVEISTNNPLVLHLHLQSSNPYLFMWLWASWVCLICSSVCWLRTGLLFSYIIGTIIISISGTVAASVSFLIARYFSRDRILKLAEGNKKFLTIDKVIGENGFRVATLLRLSPLLPFSLGNYLYGLTSVKFVPYVLGRFASCIYLWERAKKNLFRSNLQICMEATMMIFKFVDVLKFLDHFLIPQEICLSLSR